MPPLWTLQQGRSRQEGVPGSPRRAGEEEGRQEEAAKTRTEGGTRKKPAEPAVSGNGATATTDGRAKQAGEVYLGHLKRIRANLDTVLLGDSKGGNWDEWPKALADLKVRELPR